jgi:hypothetical protein
MTFDRLFFFFVASLAFTASPVIKALLMIESAKWGRGMEFKPW